MKQTIKKLILEAITIWPMSISFRVASFIFLVDLGAYIVKYRPFHLTSTTEFLSLLHITWADTPTFWIGAHSFLSSIPIFITLNVLALGLLIVGAIIASYFNQPEY